VELGWSFTSIRRLRRYTRMKFHNKQYRKCSRSATSSNWNSLKFTIKNDASSTYKLKTDISLYTVSAHFKLILVTVLRDWFFTYLTYKLLFVVTDRMNRCWIYGTLIEESVQIIYYVILPTVWKCNCVSRRLLRMPNGSYT
jgi:hypothetical protein